jgi:hypothetical protein
MQLKVISDAIGQEYLLYHINREEFRSTMKKLKAIINEATPNTQKA